MTVSFAELGLGTALVRALDKKGYSLPTPIQTQAIPAVLAGADVLATAQTGTGKTAGFALPMLQMLSDRKSCEPNIRALILTPTRELAEQIDRNINIYSANLKIRSVVVVGGVAIDAQRRKLRRHPEIVVATPGRLLDLLKQKALSLANVEMLVLDEADRMLDMGFIGDVKKIAAKTAKDRQTLLFSATISKEIGALARTLLREPKHIEVAPSATVVKNLTQSVYFVEQDQKRDLLTNTLEEIGGKRVLVFARTKHRANRLTQQLAKSGVSVQAIHSNKSQSVRRRALAAFDSGKVNVLIATDVVARGIDVKEISHVINFELPEDAENYVHRIGRTARAERPGTALSFCSIEEVARLRAIERLTNQRISIEQEHPLHSARAAARYEFGSSSPNSRTKPPQRRKHRGERTAWDRRSPGRHMSR